MMIYPSKEDILSRLDEFNTNAYEAKLVSWKEKYYDKQWSSKSDEDKLANLKDLVLDLWSIHSTSLLEVACGSIYACDTRHKEVLLGERPSIISTLHELGHAIYGVSELAACLFSIKLFKTVFPNEYNKLVWRNHMLVKPT